MGEPDRENHSLYADDYGEDEEIYMETDDVLVDDDDDGFIPKLKSGPARATRPAKFTKDHEEKTENSVSEDLRMSVSQLFFAVCSLYEIVENKITKFDEHLETILENVSEEVKKAASSKPKSGWLDYLPLASAVLSGLAFLFSMFAFMLLLSR